VTISGWTKVALFLTLLSSISCATQVALKVHEHDVMLERPNRDIVKIRYKLLKVESGQSGIAMVLNRRNYLLDLFTQSEDPYFGTQRWSQECLSRNQIGSLKDDSEMTQVLSFVTANNELNVGYCGPTNLDAINLVGYCKSHGYFFEITAVLKSKNSLSFRCPDVLLLKK
jgi:hypothetical protein